MNKTQVLIIDDERLVRRAMADYLAERGYETTTASAAVAGLAQVYGILGQHEGALT